MPSNESIIFSNPSKLKLAKWSTLIPVTPVTAAARFSALFPQLFLE